MTFTCCTAFFHMAHIAVSRLFVKALGSTQRLKGYLYQCRLHLMPAVPCQAQTVAVFISHMAIDPVACWDAELVAWLAECWPVTTSLSGCFTYLSASYLPACISFSTCLDVSHLTAFLSSCLAASVLPPCTSAV